MTKTAEQQACPYCHSDGNRLDNESVWGSGSVKGADISDDAWMSFLRINLSKR